MARTRTWWHNQVKVALGLPANTTDADLASGNGSQPNPVTSDEQIDRYVDEARYLVCRHLRLIPGRAQKTVTIGGMFYNLADFDAVRGPGTTISNGGDGSRLWAVQSLAWNGTIPLRYCRWEALRLYVPGYETDPNSIPQFYFPTDEAGERFGVYPRPPLAQPFIASGYIIPPSITWGSASWDFLADEEFAPLVSYACFKIGEQAGPGLDNSIAQKMGLFAADWNNSAAAWFSRLTDQQKRDYRMVLPLLGNAGATEGDQ